MRRCIRDKSDKHDNMVSLTTTLQLPLNQTVKSSQTRATSTTTPGGSSQRRESIKVMLMSSEGFLIIGNSSAFDAIAVARIRIWVEVERQDYA
ncbi:hypothetical protein M3J09_004867 [Ascochyta lentis]